METFGLDSLNLDKILGMHFLKVTLGLDLLNLNMSLGLPSLKEGDLWAGPEVL